ncbi:uncharacterized protein LOC127277270 [Leptopilina boulardi]|uniref:uncharacterized protein LOC127277270 n=1 Tax=Leptopilina boulardi TaxID=63433 RepID=UPI0021F63451|nr:uncharacterized protein LOC127277270 [Leptopilina boulardi]
MKVDKNSLFFIEFSHLVNGERMRMTNMNLETRQRALFEWWNEETEYFFQRIEHWAACARGYNRLRSQKNTRNKMKIIKEENSLSSRWSIAGNKLFIEETSFNPRLQPLNRSYARQSEHEELKLNCCGTLNYRSNGKLDSTCLETYSYDHSIYFKTIGDLRRNRDEIINESSLKIDEKCDIELNDDEIEEFCQINVEKFDENANIYQDSDIEKNNLENWNNNNNGKMRDFRKIGKYQQVAGDEIWPGVLVTYRKNIDPTSSPHRYVESVSGSDCYFVPGM